jgi:hypothetical protein
MKKIKRLLASKKSIFYTIAAIALTAVIITTYGAQTRSSYSKSMEAIEARIETMNFFVIDMENDLNNGAYIAAFRTLLSLNQFITTNGTYVTNLEGSFKESFLNGTVNGRQMSLMQDSTFTNWAERISAEAQKIGISFNFSINSVSINQTDPWTVEVGIDLNLSMRDNRNTSSWEREKYLATKIGITGFEDPFYVVNSYGRVTNAIIKSNITDFAPGGIMNNLIEHMNYSYYIAHEDAPSFLMRLEGNFGNSTNGIESLVNLEEFQQQGIAIKDRSIVDFIYFGTKSTANFRINSTPEWFKIDQEHLDSYGVTNFTI